jgi:small subunit ribosomal protein S2
MKSKYTLPSLLEMLKAGVHFGHQTSRWHPKMRPFIFTSRNDIHVINLETTQKLLQQALDFLYEQVSQGGEVLLVGTKKQIRGIVRQAAQDSGSPYVVEKWVGGTFTNFKTIFKLIKKLEKLEKQKEKGEWKRYTKKEQLDLDREYLSLQQKVGGIRQMSRLPAAVFVVDIKEEKTAVAESRKKNIPIVAICDTNTNPDLVDFPIPGNDDAVRSVELLVNLVSQVIKAAREERKKHSDAAAVKEKSASAESADKKEDDTSDSSSAKDADGQTTGKK